MGKRTRNQDEDDEPVEAVKPAKLPERDDPSDELPPEEEGDGRRSRVMRFAKRLMDRRELSNDTREMLVTVLATSDKAKNEAVRIAAREVRSYLDALELKDDLKDLITSYSLEISLSLKPLAHAVERAERAAEKGEAPDEEQD